MIDDAKPKHQGRVGGSVSPGQTLERRLFAYALAGAGAVALTPAASAEIVFTPADVPLTRGILEVDLNHDGIHDLSVSNYEASTYYWALGRLRLDLDSNPHVAVLGARTPRGKILALPAPYGLAIGPDTPRSFLRLGDGPLLMASVLCTYNLGCRLTGRWANLAKKFLGIRFEIDGQIHYGWARFSVHATKAKFPLVKARLTGYAYETEPNKTILAGDRGFGVDQYEGDTPEGARFESERRQAPLSLGLLSLGSLGLGTWRYPQDLKSAPASHKEH